MISANLAKGIVSISGPEDIILTEMTILIKVILNRLTDEVSAETANLIFANLANIAATNLENFDNLVDIYKDVEKLLDEELKKHES